MKKYLTVKQYRELLGYTQKDLSENLKITQAAYSQIENGYHRTSTENYQKIAKFFGIDLEYIIDDHIPVFIYIFSKKNQFQLEDQQIKEEIEMILNEISDKIKKLKENNRL
jgi:transcriptional regulator with XRE-family HTH domain